jgi:hypothetical protein
MADRPSDLAERMSHRREANASLTFTLPVEGARSKAREFLNQIPQDGYSTVVEHWRQLPDGQIEFTARRFRTAD